MIPWLVVTVDYIHHRTLVNPPNTVVIPMSNSLSPYSGAGSNKAGWPFVKNM